MSKKNVTNYAASAYAKLKNIADSRGWNFMHLLIRYATERFFYRLSISDAASQFVLKGGNLFVIWQNGNNSRPTIDSDMLCFGNAEPGHLYAVFKAAAESDICPEDGMRYDVGSIEISAIREDTEYGGTRIMLFAFLLNARIRLQFDIGIGDAITPAPVLADFPVLLNGPVPKLKTYPMPTAIAEKAEVMVTRGSTNSRMKDYYDIWLLSQLFEHDYAILSLAVKNTFGRRSIMMPDRLPEAFTEEFFTSRTKALQWRAFLRNNKMITTPRDFAVTAECVTKFLLPVFFPPEIPPAVWKPGMGWQ